MSSSTSSTTLSIPRSAPASSNAAIRLLAQVYLPGQSLEITEADGSEVRSRLQVEMSGSSSSSSS